MRVRRTLRLHLNENLFTADSPVARELSTLTPDPSVYPDMSYARSRDLLAHQFGIPANWLVFGNGSTELVQSIYALQADANGQIIFPWPSYILYQELDQQLGGRAVRVPLRNDGYVDLERIARTVTQETSLILLCNPNNPTGTAFTAADLRTLRQSIPSETLVAVDEAYIDFLPDIEKYSAIGLVEEWPRLLVIRSLSKLYGLAGLRLGFAVGSPGEVARIREGLPNWNVNSYAEFALASCMRHETYFRRLRNRINRERTWLKSKLEILGFDLFPSVTNFLCVRHPQAESLALCLEESGILVRSLKTHGPLHQHIRITVGRRQDNRALLDVLREGLARKS